MSEAEFGLGIPFAIGSVRGFRGWKVTTDGYLAPLARSSGKWFAEGNEAECNGYPTEAQVPRDKEEKDWDAHSRRCEEWRANHDMTACGHGFYAYTNPANTYSSSHPQMLGVIEGYGEVTIGTKGFRAMKARIVALSTEPFQAMWRLEPFFLDLIRKNYRGVAFFDSTVAMRSEFPADLLTDASEMVPAGHASMESETK